MATSQVVDFSNVKDGGEYQPKRVPAGDYVAKIVEVKDGKSKKDDEFQWIFKIKLQDSRYSSASYPYYCKLSENQLWKLRNLFVAAGLNVPKKKVKVDPNRVIGKLIGVTMEDDEYDGKLKSVIGATFPASEIEDSVPSEDDDYEDEEGDEEEYEDEEPEEEPEPPRRTRKKAAPEPEPEEEEEEEYEDEEEEEEEPEPEPTPPPRRRAKKAAPARRARAKQTVSDDELEELDIDNI